MKDIEKFNRNNVLDLSNGEVDITGLRFGHLQAIRQTRKNDEGKYLWLCLCECLKTCEWTVNDLNSADTITSCECKDGTIKCITPDWLPIDDPTKRPVWMTRGQLDLLLLITPGPLGKGMTITAACKVLGITNNAGFKKLRTFKDRFPKAWGRILVMRRTMKRHRDKMREDAGDKGVFSLEALIEQFGQDVVETMIKHKF
jgi:hypothetical protein